MSIFRRSPERGLHRSLYRSPHRSRSGLAVAAAAAVALAAACAAGALSSCALPQNSAVTSTLVATELERLQQQVFAAERAFARSMAERDHGAFVRHLSEEALFFSGREVLRGKAAVAAGWKRFYEGSAAPFSWEPDQVEVLAGGSLALSTGPVRNAAGQVIARFQSIWRQEAPGAWRVVFDKGSPPEAGLR